jgi:hypothetical protein
MEKEIQNTKNTNLKNNINNEESLTEKKNYNLNEFNYSFENKKEINDNNNVINFFSNIILEKESENKNDNDIADFDEDNKEENIEFKTILDDLNKNIEINVKELENENYKECQEILEILKYPRSDKNIRGGISPFKPLLKPKKISLVGKVFYNIPDDENNNTDNNNNTTENTTYNYNNNGNFL